MEEWIKAIILGIVEGLTEFLPVSSTGHLILVNQWIRFDESFTIKFDVIIQLGAILAVVVYFRHQLFNLHQNTDRWLHSAAILLWKKIFIGLIPAIILGAVLHSKIEEWLFNPYTVAIALIAGGIGLLFLEKIRKNFPIQTFDDLSYRICFLIGVFQCLAMVPGTSRSAATIIGAMVLGCSRVVAVEYSFFLAIPTMIAASTFTFFKMGFSFQKNELIALSIGFIVSFLVAWMVIAAFMKWISRQDFRIFGLYRIILGSLVLLYFLK